MSGFNKVILLGNLTRDPEVRSTPNGQRVTSLGLALNRTYRVGGQDGEKREEVTFVDVDFWARAGELIAQYLKKGDPIFVEGRLHFRSWEAKDGSRRSKLSVTGENFQFVGRRSEGGSGDFEAPAPGGQSAGGDAEGYDEVPF